MKKCFMVSYNGLSNSGGVEKVCNYLYEIFNDKIFDVHVVDNNLISSTFYGKFYKLIFGKIHIVAFSFFSSLYIALQRKKGDIKIAHGFNSPFFKTDYLFVHGTMQGYINETGQTITKGLKILFWLEKKACKNAGVLLSVSQNAINEVKKYYTSRLKKFFIVNNGVDEKVFYPIKGRVDSGTTTILYCGRLDFGKGVRDILELAKSIEGTDRYKLLIACNNDNNVDLFQRLSNTTIKVGLSVDKMNEFYNSGDIMFFPSKYEGFEMVTLEALSAGIPVIGNDVGAVSELVKNNCPGVELIEKNNLLTQVDRVCNLYRSKREELHNYYTSSFGIEVYKERLYKIIK